MKQQLERIIEYLKTEQGKFLLVLLVGITIRVVIAILFYHGDLKSTYKRAYGYLWEDYVLFEKTLDFIPHIVEMVNLVIYRMFIPNEWLHGIYGYPIVFTDTYEYLNLFVYKLPYLLFDVANFFLIKKLFEKNISRAFGANVLYFLNPILIFSVFAWGRYEVIPIFFILLGIYLYKKDKTLLANIIWGLSILSRVPFVFFTPIISILTGKTVRQKAINLFVSTIIPLAIGILLKSVFNTSLAHDALISGDLSDFIWGTYLLDSEGVELPIFFIGYTIIGYFALVRSFKEKVGWEEIVLYIGLILGLMYGFLHMHPQYYAWGIPFFAIAFSKKEYLNAGIIASLILTVAYPLILLTWDNDVMRMFRPLSFSLSQKDLIYIVDHHIFPSWRLIYFGRAVSSGIYLIFMGYFFHMLEVGKTFKESFKIKW